MNADKFAFANDLWLTWRTANPTQTHTQLQTSTAKEQLITISVRRHLIKSTRCEFFQAKRSTAKKSCLAFNVFRNTLARFFDENRQLWKQFRKMMKWNCFVFSRDWRNFRWSIAYKGSCELWLVPAHDFFPNFFGCWRKSFFLKEQ